jgi:TPP-dependent pyruvate/acetoin dehydrogenase alpha subunit
MTTPIDDLARRADAYGMPGIIVDGQDVETVQSTVLQAIAVAREGNGPSLLEMKTYRYRGHSRSDPAHYRPEGELLAWQARDPITILGNRLAEHGVLSAQEQADVRNRVQTEIDTAAAVAEASPAPTLEEISTYVYTA